MRQSDRKYLFCCVLAVILGAFVLLSATGCSDNPEDQKAKTMRQQTAEAVNVAVKEKDLAGSQSKIQNALSRHRTSGLTQDSALLVSGNLALVRGQQMQAEMGLKALPIRGSIDALERLLRRTESLLVEKERMTELLSRGDREIQELTQLLGGQASQSGLTGQLADANGLGPASGGTERKGCRSGSAG
ncbi:MAG: hypothetical protein ACYTET_01870 [Planctomycetota bacterium]